MEITFLIPVTLIDLWSKFKRSGYSHRRGANKDFFLLIRTTAVKHTNNALNASSVIQPKLLEYSNVHLVYNSAKK